MTDIALDAPRRDARVISLIGGAHCSSHFFQLVLPPLFPLMKTDFGVDFESLGFMISVFFFVSAIAQVVMGFIVDRFGAHRVLPVGIACLGLAMLGIGFAQNYWVLLPFAALGGIGNSVFHPADYSVLTARVSPSRMARAYSVHTVSGTIGWTLAPITMLLLSQWLGWRGALMAVGVLGLLLAAFIATEHSELMTGRHAHPAAKRGDGKGGAGMFMSLPILMAFLYFVLLATAGGATQSFFPTMLPQVQGITLALATTITTAYLAASAFGSFAGGFAADMTKDHDRVIAAGLLGAAALALVIGFVPMPVLLVFAAALAMGFLSGSTMPSRDMLVRAATPPGSTGKVFGFVYSGLDLGSLVSPVAAGALIDHGQTPYVFVFIAAALAATVAAAIAVKRNRQAR
jgi:MFS transporter, FSR family, fosmidomycin resistance protein